MTDTQKENIRALRLRGMGYRRIADTLGIPANTVKSHCQRNPLTAGDGPQSKTAAVLPAACKRCGRPLEHISRARRKVFCGDKCRYAWWSANPDQRESARHTVCACCGKMFAIAGNRERKYCGYPCYISSRFKGGISSDQETI